MTKIFSIILLICSVLAAYYATRTLYNQNYKSRTYRLLSYTSLASCMWSAGYGMMLMTRNLASFTTARWFGILGIILFMVFAQLLMGAISDEKNKLSWWVAIEICLGVVVFFLVVRPSAYRIIYKTDGLITEFTSPIVGITYTLYIVLIAAVFIGQSLSMAKSKESKLVKRLGKNTLKVEGLILVGIIIDTILPALGINYNIPASTILQFAGLVILHFTVSEYNRNTLNVNNMAVYVYKSLKAPVFIFDPNHHIKMANDMAISMVAKTIGEENITEKSLEYRDVWGYFNQTPPANIAESKTPIIMDVQRADRDIYLNLSINAIYNHYDDFVGYFVVAMDIAEQLKNKELEEATKIKTQFLANMSHEIRTPLNAILGFNDAILHDSANQDKVISYANSIKDAGASLKGIINEILDISKIEMGQLEIENHEYSIVSMLDNVSSMFELLATNKGLHFEHYIDENLPKLMVGDERHIRQVLTNIISNAVKYTDEGNVSLTVKLLNIDPDTKICKLYFSIKDTGRGIKEEDREKLFEKFSRLDKEHFKHAEGTGLGMSIVQLTLKEMGSVIQFDSEYGVGSDFYFELEQVALTDEAIGDFLESRKKLALKNVDADRLRIPDAKLLIVDDVQMNLDSTCALLEFTKAQVDTASSGEEALKKIESKEYDMVFMDHMMPVMDGIEATKKIREMAVAKNDAYFATLPVIALTANAIVGMREIYQDVGMQDFIAKPIDRGVFVACLKRWLPLEKIRDSREIAFAVEENDNNADINIEWDVIVPGFDLEEAKKYNLSPERYEKNLREFTNFYSATKREINDYFELGNVGDYTIKVHGLKSTSKMIGAMQLSNLALEIEQKSNEGQMLESNHIKLMELYDDTVRIIEDYLNEANGDEEVVSSDAMTDEEYEQLIKRIKKAADSFDAAAFMTLEDEINDLHVPAEHEAQFEEIKNAVSMLAFSQITDLLK